MEKTEIVKIDPKQFGLEEKNVMKIEEAFTPKIIERDALSEVYSELIKGELTEELSVEAGSLRRKLVKVRTGIAEIHKTQKAYFYAAGKFVDAWKNKETEPVTQMESKLSEIEKHAENIEKQRIATLQTEREEELKQYEVENVEVLGLGVMPNSVWDSFLAGTKASHDAKIAEEKKAEDERVLAEKKAKEEEEKKRQEEIRIAAENAKKEAEAEAKKKIEEEKQKAIEAEKARIAAEKKAEKDRKDALKKAEEDKKAAIEEEKQKAIKADKEKKLKEESDKKAAIELELSKGDAEKVKDLNADLKALKVKYQFKSAKNNKMYADVGELLDKVINFIG